MGENETRDKRVEWRVLFRWGHGLENLGIHPFPTERQAWAHASRAATAYLVRPLQVTVQRRETSPWVDAGSETLERPALVRGLKGSAPEASSSVNPSVSVQEEGG